ncbi:MULTISPECIES: hypothetical protein [unclassified Janthinobacterium]|uniref:hypothetical protein n=1 Tax=unclassified Janthinobacterium TaxID=2610881 RepID=UPI000A575292|nr:MULTISPECIES: hypothetical protein [unclassified Janthinobacterium]NVI82548.1 hypothetical protein [Janthinobacterium sp. BJB401]
MKIKAIFCVGAVSLLAFLPVSQAAQPGEALAAAAPLSNGVALYPQEGNIPPFRGSGSK